MSERPAKSCQEKALDLLARRSHFRRELDQKLTRRGYDEDEVASTLARLAAEGYLDDERTAGEFVAGRRRRGPVGPMKLLADLKARGVADDIARRALDESFEDGDLEAARAAAERKLRSARPPADVEARHKLLASLARHLERKGFSGASIGRVVAQMRERYES